MNRRKQAIRTAAGVALIAGGIVMLVTPGPGWLAIGAGIAMLRRARR